MSTISNKISQPGSGWSRLIIRDDCTPSWQRYGKGFYSFEVDTHKDRKDLHLDIAEHGDKSSRRVMISLDEIATLALYNHLKRIYDKGER